MNHRERIKAALNFKRPDYLPCHESPWEQTVKSWRAQGIPEEVSLEDYFDFDLAFMYLDTSPQFEQSIVKREGGMITYQDRFGYTLKKAEGISSTIHFLNHKTVDKEAWSDIKPRFRLSMDAEEPARIDDAMYFGHFDPYPTWEEAQAKYRRLYATDRYLLFMCYGPWEATWRHRGMENLLLDTALDPAWVQEMADTYQDLVIAVLHQCLDRNMKPDGLFVADDLGMKTGLLISPQSWCDIFKPAMARLGDFLKELQIDFWLHSDGAISPLIDLWLECGIQVLNPLETKAGMDAQELRKKYCKNLAFFGNIDAAKMAGPKALIEEELRQKIPLAREGGYIMHSDHSCPPDVTLSRYRWILKQARKIFND